MIIKDADLLSKAIVRLFESERFYAEVVLGMTRILSNKVPLAGVCVKDRIELHINPDAFAELNRDEQVAVLKHECEHILRDHIARCKELAPEVYANKKVDVTDSIINNMKHMSLNISADCAINCHIPNLPKGGVYPSLFELPNGQTMEWYSANLKDNEKMNNMMNGSSGEGEPGKEDVDMHELWGESEEDKEILREKVKQSVNKAAQRTRAAGKMTYDNELLVSTLTANVVNWKSQLSNFVARNIESLLESSKKKRNRRYGITIPGTIKFEKLHLGVAIDTSGSVSDEALQQFMSEINNIAKYAQVTVVEADSEIKNTYVYDSRKKYTISGRGGTAYKPAFDFFDKDKTVDAVIYFGDMDNYDSEELKKPKYPVLWAIVGQSEPPADFGRQIRIKTAKV